MWTGKKKKQGFWNLGLGLVRSLVPIPEPLLLSATICERHFKPHISIPSIITLLNHLKLRQSPLTLRWTLVASARLWRLQKHSALTLCVPPLYLLLVGAVSVSSRELGLAGFRLSGSNGEGNG